MQYQVKRIQRNNVNYVTPKKLDIFFKYIDWDQLYLESPMGVRDEIVYRIVQNKGIIKKAWLQTPTKGLFQILETIGFPSPNKGHPYVIGYYSTTLRNQGIALDNTLVFTFVTEEGNYIEKTPEEFSSEEWNFIFYNKENLILDGTTMNYFMTKGLEYKGKAK